MWILPPVQISCRLHKTIVYSLRSVISISASSSCYLLVDLVKTIEIYDFVNWFIICLIGFLKLRNMISVCDKSIFYINSFILECKLRCYLLAFLLCSRVKRTHWSSSIYHKGDIYEDLGLKLIFCFLFLYFIQLLVN